MIWEEDGKYPKVIVELLSDSTAEVDRDEKKRLYAKTFRTPEYFWFAPDPDSQKSRDLLYYGEPISPYKPLTRVDYGANSFSFILAFIISNFDILIPTAG